MFSKFLSFFFFWQISSQNLTFLKLTETLRMSNCYMLVTILRIFFWQIWCQNLKFSKSTEIWYRDTLLHADYDFNVSFFNILSVVFFWANLFSKSEDLPTDWNLVQGYITICLLRFWCLFVQKFCHAYKFGLKIWSSNWLESSICVHYYYYALIVTKSSKFLKFSCSRYYGQTSLELVFSKLTELYGISMLNFSKYGEQRILGRNLPQKFMNDKYFDKLHIKTVINI